MATAEERINGMEYRSPENIQSETRIVLFVWFATIQRRTKSILNS